jgi:hypothetical protein
MMAAAITLLQAQPESASLIFRLDHETGEAELCEGWISGLSFRKWQRRWRNRLRRLGGQAQAVCVSQNGSNAVFSTVTRLSSAESQGLRNCLMTKIAQIFVIRQAGMLAISGGVQAFCMREGCVAAAAL